MTFEEYREKAISTKIYSDDVAIPYVVSGTIGEVGELITAIDFAEHNPENIIKEAGDVFWYIAAVCTELEIPVEEIRFIAHPLDLYSLIKEVNKSLYTLAEILKKYLRDDYPQNMSDPKRMTILRELSFLYCATQSITFKFHNISLEEVLSKNLEKLQSRKERGVLGGSGDNR